MEQNRTNMAKDDEIDLLQLAAAIWDNILLVIIAAIICGAAALAYTYFMVTPTYSASTTMYVNTNNISLGSTSVSITSSELTTADKMVDIYITILGSRETLQEVAQQAGIEYDYDKLSGMISATSGSGAGVFIVTVKSSSPTEAELIANTVASVLPDRISDIVDGTSPRIIENAVVPTHRSSPSYTRNTAMGFLIGIVISCAIIVLLDLIKSSRDTRIHSTDELKQLFPDIPVLATIPDMRQSSSKSGYYSGYYGSDSGSGKGGRK